MKKGIKTEVSMTARVARFTRAMSYFDKNPYYKTDDYIAPVLIPSRYKIVVRNAITHFIYRKRYGTSGVYEYIVARTKLIDGIFQDFPGNIRQVLVFGAGFDTRAIRFKNSLTDTTVFELDSPITQQAKIKGFRKANIELPSNLKFVSIDFSEESMPQKLGEAGFRENVANFCLLEGLTPYLSPEAVASTFKFLGEYSGKGSLVVFDCIYASVLRRENIYYGEEESYGYAVSYGEPFRFGIEKGGIEDFLSGYDFKLVDKYDAARLEDKYFTDAKGVKMGRVNAMHNIVIAEKV
jgi:methyltransferase (TIGR00027 family)